MRVAEVYKACAPPFGADDTAVGGDGVLIASVCCYDPWVMSV